MQGSHHEPTEPRIVKKKKSHQAGHGGAWKVAYADFVTAMMALFIVLWIMSQSQSIRQNVAQYFKNPGILPGATALLESSDMGGKIPTPGHSQELQTPSPIRPEIASDMGSFEEVKKRITEVIAQLPELSRMKDQVLLEITDEGLRIELLDRESSHFFDIGSTNLRPETKEILALIAQELGKLPHRLTIEGHTDSRPYGSQNYTNWELSADRANTARRLMEAAGLRAAQVTSVRGCADQQLRNPQDPMDVQNRRVSIVVKFQDKNKAQSLEIPNLLEKAVKTQAQPGPPPPQPSLAPPGGGKPPPPQSPPEKAVAPKPDAPGAAVAPRSPASQDAPDSKAGGTQATPSKAGSSAPPPSAPRLEDRVREELQQLLRPGGSASPAPGNTSNRPAEPGYRLGW